MGDAASRLSRKIGYSFSNPGFLTEALTHRSAGSRNYERLEFLGDAVLNFVIADELFRRFPDRDEGSLSRLRARLVRGDSLAELARGLDLGEYLVLGPGELKSGGHRRGSILADALEAVIGAVYVDGGYTPCRELVISVFRDRLASVSLKDELKDAKTRLQEHLQSARLPLPVYRVIAVDGEPHEQVFRVECVVAALEEPVIGIGSSRRKAEQAAARGALELLEKGNE